MSNARLRNLKFHEVNVRILSIGDFSRVLVEWKLEPTNQSLRNLVFHIDRGESPTAMTQITTTPIASNSLYQYIDYNVKLKDVEKIYYYQVRAVELYNGTPVQTFEAKPVTWEGLLDIVGLYIIEEHMFAFRHVHGMPSLIYKKMKEGERCDICWDNVLKRVTKSNCITCKGTGFMGGYYPYMESWMDFNPDPKSVQIAEFGERQPSQTDAMYTNYPIMNSGDIVVELAPYRFWRVVNVRNAEKNRTTTLQIMRLDEINRSDIELQLAVPEDVRARMLKEENDREKFPEF